MSPDQTSPSPVDGDRVADELAEIKVMAAHCDSCAARFAPRLLAALEVALALHKPTNHGDCWSCLDAFGERELFPCGEYQAISAALLGESP